MIKLNDYQIQEALEVARSINGRIREKIRAAVQAVLLRYGYKTNIQVSRASLIRIEQVLLWERDLRDKYGINERYVEVVPEGADPSLLTQMVEEATCRTVDEMNDQQEGDGNFTLNEFWLDSGGIEEEPEDLHLLTFAGANVLIGGNRSLWPGCSNNTAEEAADDYENGNS